MTEATGVTASQNMDRSHQEHWIPDKTLSMENMHGYRYAEVRRSLKPDHALEPRWMRRLATAPAALVILSCLANAFVWATEVSKR